MTIHLDHTIVPSRSRDTSAKSLAKLLGVPCGPARLGPFFAVYVNDGLTQAAEVIHAPSVTKTFLQS